MLKKSDSYDDFIRIKSYIPIYRNLIQIGKKIPVKFV